MENYQAFPSTSHRVGLALIASAGLLSALSSFSLLVYIAWTAFSSSEKLNPFSRGLRTFTVSSLAWYLISLLLCDLFQGVAFALNFRWAAKGLMDQGKICAMQGIVSQIGDLGAAIWSTAIAFHTFWLLFLIRHPHRLTMALILVGGWSILIILPILGPTIIQQPTRGSFYGLSGAWCWIGQEYGPERVIYLYGWVFGALGSSFIIYTLIYLRFSGFITSDDAGKIHVHLRRPSSPLLQPASKSLPSTGIHSFSPKPRELGRFPWGKGARKASTEPERIEDSDYKIGPAGPNPPLKRVARRIMWYPLLYAVVVIPVSICRMGVLAGWEPPFELLVFAGICFGSSGLSNTILFLTTRKSFVSPVNKAAVTRVRVTTHNTTTLDTSTADRAMELEPIKFSRAHFVSQSPGTKGAPVILYTGHSQSFDSLERSKAFGGKYSSSPRF